MIIITCALSLGLLFLYLFVATGLSGPLPTEEYLRHAHRPLASRVFALDGSVFGKIYLENRSETQFEQCPQFLHDALIATEDIRFYTHHGVDYRSLGRVFVKGILMFSSTAGGGSTISQQLAKNLFPRQEYFILSTLIHKVREIIVARRIEKIYTKDEILAQYLNTVSFGEHAFGIGTAAHRFFNKTPEGLRLEEAATLVGMLKAPTYYSPRRFPERARLRRNVVLRQMAKYAMLEPKFCDSLQQLPLSLEYSPEQQLSEFSGYFLAHVEKQTRQILHDFVEDGTKDLDVRVDGLKIYTTIDPVLQKYAESAIKSQMPRIQNRFDREWGNNADWETSGWYDKELRSLESYQRLMTQGVPPADIPKRLDEKTDVTVFSWDANARTRQMSVLDSLRYYKRMLQAGFFALDPVNGYVKAWVGGIHHRYFPFDHVFARRQAGSTFKPVVYAAALEAGIDPCHYYNNDKQVFEEYENWSPGNSNHVYGGCYSLKGALANSVNTVAVQVLQDAGIHKTIELAKRLGIHSPIPAVPSIALGTAEVQLDELVKAYCAFVNGGKRISPVTILKIEDRHGKMLYQYNPPSIAEVAITDTIARMMLDMLEMVVDTGTARGLRTSFGLALPLAGKTGTTQRNTDGWFIGIVPELVTGVWVGADDARVHFKTLGSGQGANTAMQIFGQFLHTALKDPVFNRWSSHAFYSDSIGLAGDTGCPLYSDLRADEMETSLAVSKTDSSPGDIIAQFLKSIFSPREIDFVHAEQKILTRMQKSLDRTVVRMQKQGKSPGEIRLKLDEIRKEHYARIEELRRKQNE